MSTMLFSSSRGSLVFFLSLLILLPPCFGTQKSTLTYHGGPILTGNIQLALVWYGRFGRVQKNTVRSFIDSLKYNAGANLQPQVSSWWKIVEQYQEAAGKGYDHINVKVVKQLTDPNCSLGKHITKDFVKPLVEKASGGNPNIVTVIFTAKDVSVPGLCSGKCSSHDVLDKHLYILVGNLETECPGACAWPFHKADQGPLAVTLNPPNGNVGADAVVISFAQALIETVTNPFNTGFFQEGNNGTVEAGSACRGIFGSGAFEGYTGKVRIDPATGGGFNAHGSRDRRFLVPSIWNSKTKSCWTIM